MSRKAIVAIMILESILKEKVILVPKEQLLIKCKASYILCVNNIAISALENSVTTRLADVYINKHKVFGSKHLLECVFRLFMSHILYRMEYHISYKKLFDAIRILIMGWPLNGGEDVSQEIDTIIKNLASI